jgi:hypothetical protein
MTSVVGDMAKHAADYANLEGAAAASFSSKALAAAAKVLNADGNKTTVVVFAAADGTLKLTIGSESISQPLTTS